MAQITPAELAERRQQPLRVSGQARGNPGVVELLAEHYPELVTPPRPAGVSLKALNDPRVIDLLSEHFPDLVVEQTRTNVRTAELRAMRMATGLTQAEFAAEVDLSESQYRNFELGHKEPYDEALKRIATRLGVDPSDLLISQAA